MEARAIIYWYESGDIVRTGAREPAWARRKAPRTRVASLRGLKIGCGGITMKRTSAFVFSRTGPSSLCGDSGSCRTIVRLQPSRQSA